MVTQFAYYDQGADRYWGIPYDSMIFNASAINRKRSYFSRWIDCDDVLLYYVVTVSEYNRFILGYRYPVLLLSEKKLGSLLQLMFRYFWGASILFCYSRCPMLQVPPKLYSKNHGNLRSVNSLKLLFFQTWPNNWALLLICLQRIFHSSNQESQPACAINLCAKPAIQEICEILRLQNETSWDFLNHLIMLFYVMPRWIYRSE